MDQSLLGPALKYEQLGLSVIPLVQGHKFPPKNVTWKNRQKKRATAEEIERWWWDYQDANIGIVTGKISNLDVLDFDSPGALEQFEAVAGELPETIRQTTGRGFHACFKYHGGGRGINSDSKYGGLDVDLKTDGGIFVVAPSIHKNGRRYQWGKINPLEVGLDDLLDMPEDIIEWLVSCKQKQHKGNGNGVKLNPKKILTGAGIPDGFRNKDLYRYACRLRGKGMDISEALVLVKMAAMNCAPPCSDPDKEAAAKVATAWKDIDKRVFFVKDKFIPAELAAHVNEKKDLFHDGSAFYKYSETGVWKPIHDNVIGKIMSDALSIAAKKSHIADALKLLEFETFVDIESLKAGRSFINLKNGMLDLEAGELLPHDKGFYSTVQIPIEFDPDADCLRFKQCLQEWFADDVEKAQTLQDFAGYCLYPKIFIHVSLFLLGRGSNGKSLFIILLSMIIGHENVSGLEPHQLSDKFLLGTLKDKLLNVSSEIQTKKQIDGTIMKQVISGDMVQADQKFKPPFTFRPIAKHIYSMNEIPVITDRTFAMKRRLRIVKFNQTFTGKKADKRLEEKLKKELPGILNWALVGLSRILKHEEIFESESSVKDKQNFMRSINPVLTFVDEECVLNDGKAEYETGKTTLHRAYVDYCKDAGFRPLSQTKFYAQLLADYTDISETRPEGGARMFDGIGLLLKRSEG